MKRFLWLSALVLAADQAVKELARRSAESVTLIPWLLDWTPTENTGIAFSILSGRGWLLGLFSLALIAFGLYVFLRRPHGALSCMAAALILGGAMGNAIDRLLRGSVTDMFEITAFRFAVFNVADAALTIGVALMIISLLTRPDEWENPKGGSPDGRSS